jgi:coenzyme F420-dependent glucose-6-phosphate dehydrogenase
MLLRPLPSLERTTGKVRFCLVVVRRGDAGYENEFWCRQRAGTAIPSRDHRSGGRNACGNLNEHITGEAWPDKFTRNARLKESAWLITQLWDGEEVTHSGLIRINKSKLYSLPTVRPKLIGAALSEETSGWLGTWADGLITTGSNSELRRNIDVFKKSGGKSKPVYCQSAIVYAPKIEDANNYALKYWRVAAVPTDQLSNLEMPRDFDSASLASSADRILSSLRITDNADKIVEWLRSDRDAGVDRVYINFIGPDWHAFLGMFAKNILLNEKNMF